MATPVRLAQKPNGTWWSLREMREIAEGAARGYLRKMGIDPLEVDLKGAWAALSDLSVQNSNLIASIWYRHTEDSRYQTTMFEREYRKWAAREREYRRSLEC